MGANILYFTTLVCIHSISLFEHTKQTKSDLTWSATKLWSMRSHKKTLEVKHTFLSSIPALGQKVQNQ